MKPRIRPLPSRNRVKAPDRPPDTRNRSPAPQFRFTDWAMI